MSDASEIVVRPAHPEDLSVVSAILQEAARWLEQRGMPMWRDAELSEVNIRSDVLDGLFFIATFGGEAAGTIKYQVSDLQFWPDVPEGESAFVHRLAVRRKFAGGSVSSAMLLWAVERATTMGLRYLRLDCEASRPGPRAIYERLGFQHHSDRQAGPYVVSRYQLELRSTDHYAVGTRGSIP
jgi:GNAT superfamily N-acetyltransferase